MAPIWRRFMPFYAKTVFYHNFVIFERILTILVSKCTKIGMPNPSNLVSFPNSALFYYFLMSRLAPVCHKMALGTQNVLLGYFYQYSTVNYYLEAFWCEIVVTWHAFKGFY